MLAVIVVILIIILGKFLYDKNRLNERIAKEGGMEHKYRELIGVIMSGDNRTQIFQRTSNLIALGTKTVGGVTLFYLSQHFEKLVVEWRMESPVYGKHEMKWEFPEFGDQQKMAERMIDDLGKYQANIMTAPGL